MQIEDIGLDPLMELGYTYTVEELHKARLNKVNVADIFYIGDNKTLLRAEEVVTEFKGVINNRDLISVIFTDNAGKRHALYGTFNQDTCTFSLHRFTARHLKCPLKFLGYRLKHISLYPS